MTPIEQVQVQIAELQDAMNKSLPNFVGILSDIHKKLKEQPELGYMLCDEEIANIVGGLTKYHNVSIEEPKAKKTINKRQGALLSEDDV